MSRLPFWDQIQFGRRIFGANCVYLCLVNMNNSYYERLLGTNGGVHINDMYRYRKRTVALFGLVLLQLYTVYIGSMRRS